MSRVKDQNYFQVTGWMITRLNLKGNELMIYAIIYGFSQDEETKFKGSLGYMQDFTGASRGTIINSLAALLEKGYIEKFSEQRNKITFNEYRIIPPVQFLDGGSTNFVPGGGSNSVPNNNKRDNKEDTKGGRAPKKFPHLFRDSDLFPPHVFRKFIETGKYSEADADHYYELILNWSNSNEVKNKRTDWEAVTNGFLIRDKKERKLVTVGGVVGPGIGKVPAGGAAAADLWDRVYKKS